MLFSFPEIKKRDWCHFLILNSQPLNILELDTVSRLIESELAYFALRFLIRWI